MTKEQILEKMIPIFRDTMGDDSLVVDESMNASSISAWDSVTHVRLVVGLEQEFGIMFDIAQVNEAKNIGELIKIIEKSI